MNKYVAAYAGTAIVMVALDMLWLGVIAKPLYQQGIGHLLAERSEGRRRGAVLSAVWAGSGDLCRFTAAR